MNKRYQVFLSSTFADLEEERKEVMTTLQKAGYFVAGMELFPSDDDESWEVIKRVIDQSDYYVLVIAGRYGSIGRGGKSFTEKEYSYAKISRLPVLVFIHSDPSSLPHKNVESANPKKLEAFKKNIDKLHNRRTWSTKHGLATEVLASLSQTVNSKPRVGWVRGTVAEENEQLLRRLNELQDRYERVRAERDSFAEQLGSIGGDIRHFDIAWGEDEVELKFIVVRTANNDLKSSSNEAESVTCSISWDRIFDLIAPHFFGWKSANDIVRILTPSLLLGIDVKSGCISDESVDAIRTQLLALRIIRVEMEERESQGGMFFSFPVELWRLTERALYEYSLKHAKRRSSE